MTRYFYTDPLSAAWMSRHFGMQLLAGSGDIWEEWMPMEDAMSRGGGIYSPYFIHPDSLHLLEPQQDDLGLGINTINPTVAFFRGIKWWALHGAEKADEFRIIQRDGKPFHWPEAE